MADYNFETAPHSDDRSEVSIEASRDSLPTRVLARLERPPRKQWGTIRYSEKAVGDLTMTNLTDAEAEALTRGLIAPKKYDSAICFRHSNRQPGIYSRVVGVDVTERLQRMKDIEAGVFTTPAKLKRAGSVTTGKNGELKNNARLDNPEVRSYHANMAHVQIAGLADPGAGFGPSRIDILKAAERMENEILEVVVPPLIAVHGLSVEMLAFEANFAAT